MQSQRCEACKTHFRTPRARCRFCPSCQWIIETETAAQEDLLLMALETFNRDIQEELTGSFWDWFHCCWCDREGHRCEWAGNENRVRHKDSRMLVPYVKKWVIADLKHRLQHAFPGSFLPCRRLRNVWVKKSEKALKEWLRLWDIELQRQESSRPLMEPTAPHLSDREGKA